MLDDAVSKKFRDDRHQVKAYVKGHLDMSGPSVSGIMTGEHQAKIMEPVTEDELYKHIAGTGYASKRFPDQDSEL